jgi:hypothetical protein
MLLVLAGGQVWLMWRHERNRTKSLRATAASLGATLKPKVTAAERVALLDRSRLGSNGHVCALTNLMEIAGTEELGIQVLSIIIVLVRPRPARTSNKPSCECNRRC